ncbi:6-aminohexanoate-dimer hydrolase [Roseovarius sp. A-2]|uniref:serine hydrolase domain-containing protein n=1 Tax=Roseovarius sp. A-2 TaxID=1570360 RepID=UPI0009B55FE6|nr:serine hydrolase [Roseovarius sp. A-2]GAW33969.1 6-aminohexanoate-dimer hydrolase [Roseovarius sp. A-2]
MRAFVKWAIRILLALVVAMAVVGLWKREAITRLWAVNTLFDADRIVANFSNMNRAFLTLPVPRGDLPVSPLPEGPQMTLPEDVETWISERSVTSLLVLHKGRIVHERYFQGTKAQDRRISWSVAKSFLSTLIGIALAEGQIGSLEDPVTRYAQQLQGSAYDGTTVRQLLQMTSGLEFDEDYLDYDSDINRMGRVLALGGTMDGFAADLTARAAPPGTRWKYISIDTHALAMVLRGATGRDLPALLSEHIIQPMGFEAEPYYLSDGEGVAFSLGGLNVTTRDYARFGLMVEQMGRYRGQQIVPEDWIKASTTPSAPTPEGALQYGYQWWMPEDAQAGEVFGHGIYGQYIYIDRARDAVIVVTSADRGFREPGVKTGNIAMLRRIAAAL